MPAASPPPPHGTSRASGARPSWRRISTPTLPCPSMTSTSSKDGTRVAPRVAASSTAICSRLSVARS
jgi:hypothetical protein